MIIKQLGLLAFGITLLGACANPEVVSKRQTGDTALTCDEIKKEIAETENFEEEARREKGVTGTNVAAGLLFWPALLVTYNNVGEAVDAAKDRREYLFELGNEKGCKEL